jgi:CRISPR system Cascade subunit CasB
VLLDASLDEMPFRLRQAVRMLAQHEGARVDWRWLLVHLNAWDHPHRWVQKQWARSYFGLAPDPAADGAPVGDTPTDFAASEEKSHVD